MKASISVKKDYWQRLQRVKEKTKVSISGQIELALEKFWGCRR